MAGPVDPWWYFQIREANQGIFFSCNYTGVNMRTTLILLFLLLLLLLFNLRNVSVSFYCLLLLFL